MNIQNKELLDKYPFLKSGEDDFTWYDAIPEGWRIAFGEKLIEDIDAVIKRDNLTDFKILDIKEKYGTLRIYCSGASQGIYDVIDKYDALSEKTCIECGKEANWISKGWISPYCNDCKKVFEKGGIQFVKMTESLEK